jgi:phage terminase large subunit-like protein
VEGAQVICVASDERQARIILNTARRMVELDPALDDRVQVFKDHLLEPHTDSTLFALPADPGALQGWDPSLAIVDELHVVTDDTFERWPPGRASASTACCWRSPRRRRWATTA